MAPRPKAAQETGQRTAVASAEIPELHELEAVVMDQVWRMGKGTVREVLGALNDAEPRARAYTTVMTIMRRLHAKGLLDRERHDRADMYTPSLTRAEYAQRRACRQAEVLVAEYGDAALAAFLAQVEHLAPERLAAVRQLVRQAESSNGGAK